MEIENQSGTEKTVCREIVKARRILEQLAEDIQAASVAGAANVGDEAASEADQLEFLGLMEALDKNYVDYKEVYGNAIDIAEDRKADFPSESDIERLREVKSLYFQALGYNKVRKSRNSIPLLNLSTSSTSVTTGSRTILPKIRIKTFSGEFADWTQFRQLFTALIINDRNLSDAERFHYLISFLDGRALDTIKHIKVVDKNFTQAWEALIRAFDDKRRLANSYLDNLLNYKSPTGRPSADSLQAYLSIVSESITSLHNLDILNLAEYVLCELALKALDTTTREAFELQWVQVGTAFPNFNSLKQFVENRCHVLQMTKESVHVKSESHKVSTNTKVPKPPNHFSSKSGQALLTQGNQIKGSKRPHFDNHSSNTRFNGKFECFVCKEQHKISECRRFEKMSPIERLEALKSYTGCRNCLHPSHQSSSCPSEFTCKYCSKKHNSSLHIFLPTESSSQPSAIAHLSTSSNGNNTFCGSSTSSQRSGVLLATVICCIQDSFGNYHSRRGVIDPGSQFSFLNAQTCKDLKLKTKAFGGSISGVNQSNLQNIQGIVELVIKTPVGYRNLETEAVIVPLITPPLPQVQLDATMWDEYKSYQLSDPQFTDPGPIHFLIGADLYPDIVTGTPIVIRSDGPRLMQTIFGFAVIGRYSSESFNSQNSISLLVHADAMFEMEQFWESEEPAATSRISPEDEICEKHFRETHYRSPTGRYVVSLPFKLPEPDIVPNIAGALNRLFSLEAKFTKNEDLRIEYHKFMREYEELGHMQVATTEPKFVIPHHPVFRVNGNDKKLRVVFDGSFRSKTGSLNDHLHIGPKLQADVSNILLNMRRFKYALSCDIVKCFRQVEIRPEERCYQQIAWRYNLDTPVVFYELNTVTYGTRPAPWLSMRAIRALVDDEGTPYPHASNALRNSIYVDDVIDGCDTVEDLYLLKTELNDLLSKGGFTLSKWASNYFPILHGNESCGSVSLCKDEHFITKVLGMHWNPRTDNFSYVASSITDGSSKRIILSTIARLFDPLGYLAPIIFHVKCIMQETWKHELDWDDEVPDYIKKEWGSFTSEIHAISNISIPRALPKSDSSYQLICFSDASERGYCGVVYIRSTLESNSSLTILKAKTRLAPLKTVTIPRLELCGALLLSELLDSLVPIRENMSISEIYCFTDSTIVLAWLRTAPHLLQPYVSRRVQKILESTSVDWWHHVKGSENPADVGSRGCTPSSLGHHPLWWSGPAWCYEPVEDWSLSGEIQCSNLPELKPIKVSLLTVETHPEFIKYLERHSSWIRLVRVIAWIKRFVSNSKIPESDRTTTTLTPLEIRESNFHIIRLLQHIYYPEIYEKQFNDLSLEHRRLDVFIDSNGLIRVGGRLALAPLADDHKHPVLLPSRCHFTSILVRYQHQNNNHVGPSTLLAILRQQYWIPNARNLVKKIIFSCVICARYSRQRVVPFMGNLPSSRFSAIRPFLVCGVDFAGYFLCKESARRNARTFKAYLSIFVCMSTRAYHLELVSSLNVEAFLDAFTRFTSRRGVPTRMMSDQGTNFKGTFNYLNSVQEWLRNEDTQNAIVNGTSHLGVSWRFNPPASPHFGGSWEIGVKAVKNLLYKTFNNLSYTQEELTTIFVKIEGILNSRPLQPLSASTDDPEALTPAHFLIGQPLTSLPEMNFNTVPTNRLSHWQLIQERIQHFWHRWRSEYISSLQHREKWTKKTPNVQVGDVVLLTDSNTPPMHWPLARILETHPGEDHIVRVVTLKTNKGTYRRPAVKLVPLNVK